MRLSVGCRLRWHGGRYGWHAASRVRFRVLGRSYLNSCDEQEANRRFVTLS